MQFQEQITQIKKSDVGQVN